MDFIFASRELERLYTHNEGASKFPAETVKLFRRRVRHIEAARDARDLRIPPGVHYERLNDRWRLILPEEGTRAGKRIVIREISKH